MSFADDHRLHTRSTRLEHRPAGLVNAILHAIHDDDVPVPWTNIVETFATSPHTVNGVDYRPPTRRTIENILYELAQYGAIERIGHPGGRRRADTRALRPTTLGRYWIDQTIPPPPGEPTP